METVYGLTGSAKLHYAYELGKKSDRPLLYITYNEIERANAHSDLCSFVDAAALEAKRVQLLDSDIRAEATERTAALKAAIDGKSIVCSIDALLNYLAPKEDFEKSFLNISVNETIELEDLKHKLCAIGYERVALVETQTQFAVRGDIVDIGCGYRIELFDNEVYSIKQLDLETQLSSGALNSAEISPITSVPVLKTERLYACIEEEYEKRNRTTDLADAKMAARLERYMHSLEKGVPFLDMESFAFFAFEKPGTILDYMDNPIIIFDDFEKIAERLKTVKENYLQKLEVHFKKGQALSLHEKSLNFDIIDTLSKNAIDLKEFNDGKAKSLIDTKGIYQKLSMGEVFFDFIKSGKEYKTYIFCGNETRAQRFLELLSEREIGAFYKERFEDIDFGQICVLPLTLTGSVEYSKRKIRLISDRAQQQKKQPKRTGGLKAFTDIKPGDYVVHDTHGIGKYIGIKSITSLNNTRDYLAIEYREGGMLYLPTEQMDKLQKYVGTSELPPRLSKIGGGEWKRVKERVGKNAMDMAEDLVKLYAKRASKKGYAFSPDTPWQREFEDSFEFEDTPDQITCTNEIKADMESNTIMDRLLCGDVGYGKTEVALRAMFKCVGDGKQAAMLAPTVVLARQHYNTITERLKDYPVRVGLLSRFSSPKELKAVKEGLKNGEIDIVIGTHKLLGKDVEYKDLGLLVVDEEQRFGVRHKEKIKMLKENVDVLTLSATPIPRTLYMSLIGIRDISVIETPPLLRQTVATYVMEYNLDLALDAINDEIKRGGQVYFLYNDVSNIERFAAELIKHLPNVTLDIGHGQMNKDRLEKTMLDFYSGKTQVLLCSTIIESGLDVTNANTVIVYDADRLGLGQLYQIRGRVGRGERQAYAYFTYRGRLSEKAHKRLSAIRDFTDFGSGFKIAMRDLEIRGAGTLMGSAQSGNMAAVGYDMYCRLIQSAVNKIKGVSEVQEFETAIKLDVDAHIPSSYIDDEEVKIDVYKRIAEITTDEEAQKLYTELSDRFGRLPSAVKRLFMVARLKALCMQVKILSIEHKGGDIVLKLAENSLVDTNKLVALMADYKLSIGKDFTIRLKQRFKNDEDALAGIQEFIKLAVYG
ncbi:MAG: transcription-repair coupling factor [Clostridia bacterium]|nr:transcription-repair coupling factor [Clostridia bacterium]